MGAFVCYLGQDKTQRWRLLLVVEVLSKTIYILTARLKLIKPVQDCLNFIFIHLNDTPVTWTLEKAEPGEEPRLQCQIATASDSELLASQLRGNMRRVRQDWSPLLKLNLAYLFYIYSCEARMQAIAWKGAESHWLWRVRPNSASGVVSCF